MAIIAIKDRKPGTRYEYRQVGIEVAGDELFLEVLETVRRLERDSAGEGWYGNPVLNPQYETAVDREYMQTEDAFWGVIEGRAPDEPHPDEGKDPLPSWDTDDDFDWPRYQIVIRQQRPRGG